MIAELTFIQLGLLLCLLIIDIGLSLYTLIWAIYLKMKKRLIALMTLLFLICWMNYQLIRNVKEFIVEMEPLEGLAKVVGSLPPYVAVAAGSLTLAMNILVLGSMIMWRRSHISRGSIKEALDTLPAGLCFAELDGAVRFLNLRMRFLASEMMGHAIMDANAFWETVVTQSETQRQRREAQPVIELTNGTVWQFTRTQEYIEGKPLWRIRAQDVTDLSYRRKQLEKENKALADLSNRLSEFGQRVTESTREQEILETKIRIHDAVGHTLLATQHSLMTEVTEEEKKAVLALWRSNLVFLRGEKLGEEVPEETVAADSLKDLETAADAIGVKIVWQGDPLPEDATVRNLTETMLHECLTNTVRHAGGTEVYVSPMEANAFWIIECTNNGMKPTEEIREGGGLGSLRKKVERAGGWMELLWKDGFLLRMAIPKSNWEED